MAFLSDALTSGSGWLAGKTFPKMNSLNFQKWQRTQDCAFHIQIINPQTRPLPGFLGAEVGIEILR